jgi:hypothetical protein
VKRIFIAVLAAFVGLVDIRSVTAQTSSRPQLANVHRKQSRTPDHVHPGQLFRLGNDQDPIVTLAGYPLQIVSVTDRLIQVRLPNGQLALW